jgi:hypothetical protein
VLPAVQVVSEYIVVAVVVVTSCEPFRLIIYAVMPTLSVDASHLRRTLVPSAATAVKYVGAVGAVVSAGPGLLDELDPQPLLSKTDDNIISNRIWQKNPFFIIQIPSQINDQIKLKFNSIYCEIIL